jgi:hypothetical protein
MRAPVSKRMSAWPNLAAHFCHHSSQRLEQTLAVASAANKPPKRGASWREVVWLVLVGANHRKDTRHVDFGEMPETKCR